MKVLAIDTCFAACMVAVVDTTTGVSYQNVVATTRGQAEILVPMIDDLLKAAGIDYAAVDLIAVDVGPGSFTGLRVGIAAARGLALALDRPVQGVMATDALYATWIKKHPDAGPIRVMIDTGRDDYFVADYQGTAGWPVALDRISIMSPDQIQTHNGPLIGTVPSTQLNLPDPSILAEAAEKLFKMSGFAGRGRAEPVYIRDAEVSISKRQGRVLLDPQIINT